ncbi:MAG: hypothetical protein K6G34_06730 [Lachnospiraceae bacterium]|nr:hypothetical protein [Lachnospiraceae bacterium]
MYRRIGYLAAGVVFGLVVTGLIVNKEIRDQQQKEEIREDGLFAEVQGNTIRLYKVENGRFCGYHETREFESQEKAVDWVTKETNAKLQFVQ